MFLTRYENTLAAVVYGTWLSIVLVATRTIQSQVKSHKYRRRNWLLQIPGSAQQILPRLEALLMDKSSANGWKLVKARSHEGIQARTYVMSFTQLRFSYQVLLHAQILPTVSTSSCMIRYWFDFTDVPLWAVPFAKVLESTEKGISKVSMDASRIELSTGTL